MTPGDIVLYYPVKGLGERGFLGVVETDEEMFCGTKTVLVGRIEAGYRDGIGRVPYADISHCKVIGRLPDA